LTFVLDSIVKSIREYGFARIIPATNLDALIASSIIAKNLRDHGIEVVVNLDVKIAIDEDEPTILIDLPKPKSNPKQYELKFDGKTSLSGYATSYLDRVFGTSQWDKVLTILSGIYRGLDRGREGFTGFEREILDDLAKAKYVSVDLGMRLWGWKKQSLAKALYRTLIPFIPGFSGDPSRTTTLLKSILGISNPESVYGEHVLPLTEENLEKVKAFLEALSKNLKYLDTQTKNRILLNIIGFVYTISYGDMVFDALEAVGAIGILSNLNDKNPYYITLLSNSEVTVASALALYNNIIDELSVDVASNITLFLEKNYTIIESNAIKRPELYAEVLQSIDRLPREKPVVIRRDGHNYTTVTELLRLNRKPAELYSHCNEVQLCMVDEHGNLIKA